MQKICGNSSHPTIYVQANYKMNAKRYNQIEAENSGKCSINETAWIAHSIKQVRRNQNQAS